MQDKEFDKLFQHRFETFELSPSSDVWNKVDRELVSQAGRERGNGIYWRAAASIVVIFGIAIWFAPEKEKVWLQKEPVVAVENKSEVPLKKDAKANIIAEDANDPVSGTVLPERPLVLGKAAKRPVAQEKKQIAAEAVAQVDPSAEISREREVPISQQPALAGVLQEEALSNEKPVLAVVSEEAVTDASAKERNVKSIGDLVNFVVGKVDKRQDKLIQFEDNDEGSFITGLNLGFVKIKSRN